MRPLSLTSNYAELIGGVLCRKIAQPITDMSCNIQRGFVKNRQMTENAIDLDCHARAIAMKAKPSHHPVAPLFDFRAALSSVNHDYLMLSVARARMNDSMRNIVRNSYKFNCAYIRYEGSDTFLLEVAAGILQGCTISGALVTICMDPLLRCMACLMLGGTLGAARAYADYFGAVLRQLSHLI